VFQAFSRVIREAGKRFVVMDTAPTGHTLLLLDATGAYHREIAKNGGKGHFTTPMMQLQDRNEPKSCWSLCLKPHRCWKRQTCRLILKERGFIPGAGLSITAFPLRIRVLRCFASALLQEQPQIEAVKNQHANRIALVPVLASEPVLKNSESWMS
jgi:arsenite-transporting ATPase